MRSIPFIFFFFLFCSFSPSKGIRYEHITTAIPQSIHVLEVNPKMCSITAARALDKCIGRETVLSLAERKGALGAFNGGFFSIGGNHEGSPCGILKIQGTWYGIPIKSRGAIGWAKKGRVVLFDRLLTHLEGIDFCIDPQSSHTTTAQWEKMDYVIGGAPLLMQQGKRLVDFSNEQTNDRFLNERHARTAVGLLPNGNWVFVVVDGKQPDFSIGMTIEELGDFMEHLGCTDALNLDGGGSSTFVYDNQVINHPAGDDDDDSHLRAVSDAILIQRK